jgi:hypothetical protein|tara:strand:- start:27 stop:239 length:213 start_codon:yes stop_codon:yes gene_type:complete
MARFKLLNGEVVALTVAEEAARDAEEAQAVIDMAAREAAAKEKQERLLSVKSKLAALGLTTEEVREAFGL